MRVLISTFGTRGDIQPAIALGQGLLARGHAAAVCTAEGYRPFIEEHGVPYAFMRNDALELTQEALPHIAGLGSAVRTGRRMQQALRRSLDDEWRAAESFQPDLIVYHPKMLGSLHIAEKLDIPAVLTLPLPFYTPTADFPVPFLARFALGGRLNRLTYQFQRLAPVLYGGLVNDFRRRTLGLLPRGRFADPLQRADGSPVPILYAFSRHVLPVPQDYPPHVHVTGSWFLVRPTAWAPAPELVRFLAAGPPPVYVGFGSMVGASAATRATLVLAALARTGQRGILASGWGGLQVADLPDTVSMVESVPHDWLFPQVAAVVHHGGAGTTAAGLRAGKPTLICPFLGDQPFWGKVVHRLGAGPAPLPLAKLTADQLATGMSQLIANPSYREQAAAIGERIRAEDGVGRAIALLTELSAPAPRTTAR
jgi:sterol 3beta-glucosyltransferase